MAIITIDEDYDDSTKLGDYYPKIKNNLRTITDTINSIEYDNLSAGLQSTLDSLSGGELVLHDGAVTTSILADGAVTFAKLADDAKVMFGVYTGDSSYSSSSVLFESRKISLGFTPTAVAVWRKNGVQVYHNGSYPRYYGGVALKDHPCVASEYGEDTVLDITDGGFNVYENIYEVNGHFVETNRNGCAYYFMAFRSGEIMVVE